MTERGEDERPGYELEVRVLWGGEPLAVHHRPLSRGFTVGPREDADLVVPEGWLGETSPRAHRLVEAEGEGARVVARPGAPPELVQPGERIRVELPASEQHGYRAAGDEGDRPTSVVLEIAVVPRSKAVGRWPALREPARRTVITGLVALGVTVGLAQLEQSYAEAHAGPAPLEVSDEQRFAIEAALDEVEEKLHGPREERLIDRARLEEDIASSMRLGLWERLTESQLRVFVMPDVLYEAPFDAELDPVLCLPYRSGPMPGEMIHPREPWDYANVRICDAYHVTPTGFRGLSPPAPPILDDGPSQLWRSERDRLHPRGRPAKRSTVTFEIAKPPEPIPGAAPDPPRTVAMWQPGPEVTEPLERVLGQRRAALAECHEMSATHDQAETARISFLFAADGRLALFGGPRDRPFSTCVLEALRWARVPRSNGRLPSAIYDVRFEPPPPSRR